jgi:S-adenosylmethionine:tRNA ribosyltransferase-isomerase
MDWSVKPMRLEDFCYALPERLIAQQPPAERGSSRLLRVGRDACQHLHFSSFPEQLQPGDLLVLNDTRVIRARLHAEKDSGGRAEILVERIEADDVALCQVRVSKALKAGRSLSVAGNTLRVLARQGEFYRLAFPCAVLDLLEAAGEVPLPTYIERAPESRDQDRYQTVYAARPGAVAAPTAGLHLTAAMLDALPARGVEVASVTLHVGAGTFKPVRTSDLSAHRMHSERYEISECVADAIVRCRARGGRVVAVGTTVVRTLESAPAGGGTVRAGQGETALFISPGHPFAVVDALLTNFHLPRSTLLMLVCAFAGYERVMAAYATAVAAEYRFFSYGDAMFLERMNDV